MDLKKISGIGDKTEKLFNKAGIYTAEDLVGAYPARYDVFEDPVTVKYLEADRTQAVRCRLARPVYVNRIRNKVFSKAVLLDENGDAFSAVWFNAPFMKNSIRSDRIYVMRGLVKVKGSVFEMQHPKMYSPDDYKDRMGEMQPVYHLVAGLTNNTFQKSVRQALGMVDYVDSLPKSVRSRYNLMDYEEALRSIHYPKSPENLKSAAERLKFQEFFEFIWSIRNLKDNQDSLRNENPVSDFSAAEDVIRSLPYSLTNAQLRTWEEVKSDLSSDRVMNRLIQGDVGSGKTIIAFLSVISAAKSGGQAVIMVPTEVLALQHYEDFCKLNREHNIGLKPVLLTGSMAAAAKREAYHSIEDGTANIVIGTHALIQDKVHYKKLMLVVTDEQHRFGVKQRETISEKGSNPHVMVMSATPIPRTLGIILYGDLDISVIDEMPAGRQPVETTVITAERRPRAYQFIRNQIKQGRQVYIICPSVEHSECVEGENVIEYSEMLKEKFFLDTNIEYLHGRMTPAEKNEIMDRFAKGKTKILVSTTVVEVGVNVPNATVMMVENAERFGLSQLHQLRGRVGRGKYKSYCICVYAGKGEIPRRLEIIKESSDGFYIANEDLKLRGPGDFFGVRQSGSFDFRLGDIIADSDILKNAALAVSDIKNNILEISCKEEETLSRIASGNINL